jgi:methionine-rich copper-binding protein CopC
MEVPRNARRAGGSRARAVVLVLAVVASLLVTAPAPASAHANLQSAVPAPNASTDGAPSQVQLRFGQPTIPDDRTAVSVIVPSGRDIAEGAALVTGFGVAQRLAATQEQGWFRVRYRVTFVDGHARAGVFRFRVTTFDRPASDHWRWLWLLGGGWVLFSCYALARHGRRVPQPG